MDTLSVVIVGDNAVGKSAYLTRYVTGDFIKIHNHNPNTTYQIPFPTNQGDLTFTVLELASAQQEPIGNTSDSSFASDKAPNGLMVMFSCIDIDSFTHSITLVHQLCTKYPDIPIVWLGNKVDYKDRIVQSDQIASYLHGECKQYQNLKYYDVSAKSNYQIENPFLHIMQYYYPNRKFVEYGPIEPPNYRD
jgi:GTPase SAR1 family protein